MKDVQSRLTDMELDAIDRVISDVIDLPGAHPKTPIGMRAADGADYVGVPRSLMERLLHEVRRNRALLKSVYKYARANEGSQHGPDTCGWCGRPTHRHVHDCPGEELAREVQE